MYHIISVKSALSWGTPLECTYCTLEFGNCYSCRNTGKNVDSLSAEDRNHPSSCAPYVFRNLTSFWGHNFDTRVGNSYADGSRLQWGCLQYCTDMAVDALLPLSSRSVSTHVTIELYTRLILSVLCFSVKFDLSPPREEHRWMVYDMRL